VGAIFQRFPQQSHQETIIRDRDEMLLNLTIHEVFSAVAARSRESMAIVGDGPPVRYAELANRSDKLAHYLIGRGIKPGERVGLYSQRSTDAIVAMLGILKAGAAFVPFDPTYPQNLLKFVYQDCAPALLLVQRSLIDSQSEPPFWSGDTVDLHGEFAAPSNGTCLPSVDRDALAYVMYTSGSTGHPKGVLVPHRGVVRLVIDNWFAEMDASQVHLQLAPLAFDASTFEIWGALLHGGTLAIVPAAYPSLDDIADAINVHQVTTLWLTAGLFHLMVDHRLDGLKPLRQLLAGGDVLSPSHIAKALQALPNCQLINGYGPTENTTFTCCYRIPRDEQGLGSVPIGTAIAHTRIYVLDELGRPVVAGQDGELYAGGAGVALGYLNRPELTAEKFLANPFNAEGSGLMYRTGDRVRQRPDGNLEFLGRVDRQVKINGKRVELDEIEACMRRSGLVEDGVVTSPQVTGASRKIYAYVKSQRDRASVSRELRDWLRRELPEHMMPASIDVLDALPLSPSGKVDRAKLAQPSALDPVPRNRPEQAGSEMETALLKIWREVLGRDSVGTHDNFFDLGGTSLQLLQVHATIRAVIQCEIAVVDLFQYSRVSDLAEILMQRTMPTVAATPVPGLMSAQERAKRQHAALTRARPTSPRGA
jgi:amino acid adenylation domain-containing protein